MLWVVQAVVMVRVPSLDLWTERELIHSFDSHFVGLSESDTEMIRPPLL